MAIVVIRENNKEQMKTRLTYLFTIVLLGIVTMSCNPEEDTIAEIIVVTPEGSRVPGAEVRMFGQGTIDDDQVGDIAIDRTQFTNSNGVAEFDYTEQYEPGQSGFAILDVEITFETPDSTSFVNGIMKVVEEETTSKTFVLGS
ncbi:MAG: hypothetical protein ACI9CP_000342 [Cryomorphaceae bacterium]